MLITYMDAINTANEPSVIRPPMNVATIRAIAPSIFRREELDHAGCYCAQNQTYLMLCISVKLKRLGSECISSESYHCVKLY